jgi:hypothetical protein
MIKFIKLLCLCLIFSQLSCEKENIEIDKNIPSKFIIKKILKSEINSVKGLNNKLQQAIQTNNNLQGRIVNDSLYNFSINTDLATFIDNGEYQTYTFEVYRNDGDGKLENLILKSDNSGGFYSILVKYDFTKEIFNQDNFNPNDYNSPLYTLIDFDYNTIINSRCENSVGTKVCGESWRYQCEDTHELVGADGNPIMDCFWNMTIIDCSIEWTDNCGGDSIDLGGLNTSPTGDNHGGYSSGGYNMTQINNAIALLPYSQQQWLNQLINEEIKTQTAIYIIQNNSSQEAVEFVTELIDLEINGNLISFFPSFRYPAGSNYSLQYPNFTILVKEYIPTLKNDTRLINTIHNLTNESNFEIINNLTWGNGPEIHITQLGVDLAGDEIHGKFNKLEPGNIYIDIDLVTEIESLSVVTNPTPEQINQLAFLNAMVIFSVCMHEYVHFSDFAFDGTMQDNENLELGLLFEELYLGGYYEFNPSGNIIFIKKH